MKAIQLKDYNRNVLRAILSLEVVDKEKPALQKDEVLVQLHAASCNPSDIAFIQGGYNVVKPLPAVPGFEGSGVVVDAGPDAKELTGKKVSCFIQHNVDGTWAAYFKVRKTDVIVLDDKMDMDQAAGFTVNPFTAYALMDIAGLRQSGAIIQNASGGQVAAMIRQLAGKRKIQTINIVRRHQTADKLKKEGVKHVLVEPDADFFDKLKQLAGDLNATTAFDAVGGPSSGAIVNAMPASSELVVYGGLSGKPVSEISTRGLIFNNKIISGFNLVDWKNKVGQVQFMQIADELQQLFISGKLKTEIQGEVRFDDIVRGLKTYIGNMSDGKILIKP